MRTLRPEIRSLLLQRRDFCGLEAVAKVVFPREPSRKRGSPNRPLYFTAKRLEINSPGLQAWVRREMKIALQVQPSLLRYHRLLK